MPKTAVLRALLLTAVAVLIALPVRADFSCSPTPLSGCRLPFVAHKSSLWFKQTGKTDPDDVYTWRWRAGSATALTDFGDPPTTTDYALCFYDHSGRPQPVVANSGPAGAGWRGLSTGYKRYDRSTPMFRQGLMHAGVDGKASILAHGDSDTLAQLLPFVAPLVVQLQTSTGMCWETTFTSPNRDDASRFDSHD